nr:pregnancy zone protein-like [Homo sapiens]
MKSEMRIRYGGQVLLVNENHQPITNKTVDVHVNTRYYFSATTDEHGLVNISMDTTNYISPFLTVSIKARGKISQSGIHVLSIEQGNMKGVFSFSFRVESDSAPSAHLLVYTVLPNGEIVADTDKLEIENCFANKVNLRFSSAQSLPASNTRLKVRATPLSLCALRAVDQSVLLMKPEAELSPKSVYNLLPVKSPFTFRAGGPADEYDEECNNAKDTTHSGITSTPKQVLEGDDIYSIFTNRRKMVLYWVGLR